VERDELLRADVETLALIGFVARELSLQRIGARGDGSKVVLPNLVCHDLTRNARGLVRERERDAGNDAVRVAHRAANAARELLGKRGDTDRQHGDTAGQNTMEASTHEHPSGKPAER